MAYICNKPANSCSSCEHYRYDDDYGGKACFAAQDAAKSNNTEKVGTQTDKNA